MLHKLRTRFSSLLTFIKAIEPWRLWIGTLGFFTLTGFHGLHVLIGVAWAGVLLLGALRGRTSAQEGLSIEIFGLYWHFVDIVWIVLFTIIYLI